MICQSVYLYCKDDISLIENYEKAFNDKNETWICHHKLEIVLSMSQKEMIKNNLYFNRPASELIFLTRYEHTVLHNKNCLEETKKKRSLTLKGHQDFSKEYWSNPENRKKQSERAKSKPIWNKGIPTSEETKKKQSIAHKKYRASEETKKKQSESMKKYWAQKKGTN